MSQEIVENTPRDTPILAISRSPSMREVTLGKYSSLRVSTQYSDEQTLVRVTDVFQFHPTEDRMYPFLPLPNMTRYPSLDILLSANTIHIGPDAILKAFHTTPMLRPYLEYAAIHTMYNRKSGELQGEQKEMTMQFLL